MKLENKDSTALVKHILASLQCEMASKINQSRIEEFEVIYAAYIAVIDLLTLNLSCKEEFL
ncbi:hypothetical protein [Photobacterium sanguinicancri]|uniref:hypothetical protein n=1 Tax=Photobacterium sanguinicancri TaxID=875932 RepID=UPI0021C4C29E|nr:hypothetical protein [Photobacterium sanguinicancri]